MLAVRLRQVALVARDLEPVVEAVRHELGLDDTEPFRDPGIAAFGLHNAVMEVGDTFLEVVSPVRPDTTAGRYLERRGGDGGYMVIFQVDDLAAARARIAGWVSGWCGSPISPISRAPTSTRRTCLAPSSPSTGRHRRAPGAGPDPGGPARNPSTGPGDRRTSRCSRSARSSWLSVGARSSTASPIGWTEALLEVDGGRIDFVLPEDDRGEGVSAIEIAQPNGEPRVAQIGGVRLVIRD
jgi:hypothetical protein